VVVGEDDTAFGARHLFRIRPGLHPVQAQAHHVRRAGDQRSEQSGVGAALDPTGRRVPEPSGQQRRRLRQEGAGDGSGCRGSVFQTARAAELDLPDLAQSHAVLVYTATPASASYEKLQLLPALAEPA
jgi:hypothetical protein